MVADKDSSNLHVLFLPSFYLDPDKPVLGIFFKEQALALKKSGLRVALAYVEPRRLRAFRFGALKNNHGQITACDEDGLPTMRLHGWNPLLQTLLGGLVWSAITQFLVGRYIKRFGRPDIMHAHNAYWAGFAAYLVWRNTGIPYVITEHSSEFLRGDNAGRPRWFSKIVYRHASKVIVVSSALGESIQPLLEKRSYAVVPNCVDTDYFSVPAGSRSSKKFVFLAIAHLSPNKGFDILLRAFAAGFRDDDNVILRIGGGGALKIELIALALRLGIERQVQFLGALTKEDVRGAMWDADAFILSSYHETFGVVLIEAMSTGLPVIATRSGGPNEIVNDEVGLLVEPGNIEEMSKAMKDVRGRAGISRSELHDWVHAKYSHNSLANKLRNVYGDALIG